MLSAKKVAYNFIAQEKNPEKIKEESKRLKEKTDALKELSKTQKEYEKVKKGLPFKLAQEPDTDELNRQLLPLLRRMGINNLIEDDETELIPGRTKGNNSLYKIVLRRTAKLNSDIVDRIERHNDNFENMKWTSNGLEVYLWWPYEASEEVVR